MVIYYYTFSIYLSYLFKLICNFPVLPFLMIISVLLNYAYITTYLHDKKLNLVIIIVNQKYFKEAKFLEDQLRI